MPLGREVGLGPDHTVLDGDPTGPPTTPVLKIGTPEGEIYTHGTRRIQKWLK